MTAISTRKNVLAIVEESTEGTPVAPTAATDYIAEQTDFQMSPETENLESDERHNSIAPSEPVPGNESPTASGSHYLRHSGVEGQAPNYRRLLKAAFGAEVVAASEFLTTAASTTAVIKSVAASTNFQRGQGILLKDGTNGYRLRAVESITGTTDILPSFNLPAAPASGIGLGKAVLYKPADEGHVSLSLWEYLGNGGAVKLLAGGKVSELSIPFESGQLINMAYSVQGTAFFLDPITITATTKYLDFTNDDGTAAAILSEQTYKDPHDLAAAIQAAMNTVSPGETATVTYDNATGKFTIASTGVLLTLKWNTGTNTANSIATKIGFTTAADSTGATTYTSANAQSFASPQTPSYDSASPIVAKDMDIMFGYAPTDNTCIKASSVTFALADTVRPTNDLCSPTGLRGSIINGRAITVEVTAELQKYDVEAYRRYRLNDTVRFQASFGVKSGGNWVPGKCGLVYISTAKISAFDIVDDDGVATLQMTLTAFANAQGQGEGYLNFL